MDNQNEEIVEKTKKCSEEISKILDEFGFILDARVILSTGRCDSRVVLLPKPEKEVEKNEQ